MTLIAAVFLLIVIGGMGLAVSSISSNHHETLAATTFSNDAYFTATAGIEWAVESAVDNGWSSTAQLAGLNGTYTMPNKNSFVLVYVDDNLTSKASVNGSVREIAFKNFSTKITSILGAP